MARGPFPAFVVLSMAFGSVVLLMSTGVRWGVRRKVRTSFNGADYLEDSLAGNQTRYRVLATSEETGGESFTVEILIREGAYGATRGKPGSQPGHLHLQQDEQLEVKKGRLGYWRGHPSLAAEVAADDEDAMVVIQQGEAHSLWNAGGEGGGDLLLEATFRPAGKGEAFYETLAGLGHDYETALAVSPLQKVLTYHRGGAVLTGMPQWLWRLCEEWLVPLAEGFGYKAFYPEYSTRAAGTPSAAEALASVRAELADY
ncbi:hypothetical protein Rsub_05925 [Raphidocelis subcapitata]|uniref:Uncharacterized protein n=1 Tax=Raphidocelis subcapitata TaxID=307507 RepID=A0A2V0P5P8_9CHLO|nr:hypothetical protein Rsub_05925 [Raphidocelis subcapitata]|eukprot:GBF93193.1 hypothetical protein Rsub_05925 [Raphidocelis subcapitata]